MNDTNHISDDDDKEQGNTVRFEEGPLSAINDESSHEDEKRQNQKLDQHDLAENYYMPVIESNADYSKYDSDEYNDTNKDALNTEDKIEQHTFDNDIMAEKNDIHDEGVLDEEHMEATRKLNTNRTRKAKNHI
eukprot:3891075-Ditylum_brightwellii.AAC.1